MAAFPATRIEGGLLGPDILEQLLAAELAGQKPADFGLEARRNLTDEIASAFADARALWGVFQNRLQRLPENDLATTVTRDAWMIPFLGLLGYEARFNARAREADGLSFAISHRAGEPEDAPPVHIVGARQELGRVPASGRPRLAPHSLVQEYLNRTEHLWGLVTNGITLRLLRNSTFVRRQAYVEFDLAAIFDEQRFQDFAVLYRLLHRTRLPRGLADASQCLLEQYYARSIEQGGRVRENLRDGVEACIVGLGNGFLRHRANDELRRRAAPDSTAADRIPPGDLYRQLLRLVYRFLFLLVSEERRLISTEPVYHEHYGIARLRRVLDSRAAYTDDDDLWQGLRVLWRVLCNERLASFLRVAPLNGELFDRLALDACTISNRDLLEAFRRLAWYQESPSSPQRRVNYAALDVEELGSVYESLLEFHPHVERDGNSLKFALLLEGGERRSTGSHYTPPELVAPLIQHALEPVLAERLKGATTGEQKERAILALKVCDLACGSGHFLLAAARRLGKELARVRTGEDEPAPERVREAVRDAISHCIYGVDKNPLAVELCRVALWLESQAEGKPLTFLDHRIRCGDSLVGVFDLSVLERGIPDEAYKPVATDDKNAARQAKRRNAEERSASLFHVEFANQLKAIAGQLAALDELPEDTIEQVRAKADACAQVERSPEFERLRLACDAWTAAFFQPYPNPTGSSVTTEAVRTALARGEIGDARVGGFVELTAMQQRFFHWPMAFPEVIAASGFHVILGNPPFLGGLKISGEFGESYRKWISSVFSPFPGTADICAVFFRRAFGALRDSGRFGLIATNTISQGDTREAGLAPIKGDGGAIAFAKRFVKWPGEATVEVNLVAIARGSSLDQVVLDGETVPQISSRFDAEAEEQPRPLQQSKDLCFIGDYVRGIGFVIDQQEAGRLLASDVRNSRCLMPYLNGQDFNDDWQQHPDRYVICFHDFSLQQAQEYPELLQLLYERVKPFRDSVKEKHERENWWLFARYRGEMRTAISGLERVLVRSRISNTHAVAFVPPNWIFNEKTIVFAFSDWFRFSLIQSSFHEMWMRKFSGTLRTDISYAPTDCFETFAFPQDPPPEDCAEAARAGEQYHNHRERIMLSRRLGLTKTYNLFHDPDCTDADIAEMRSLHAAMDRVILACYGWQDMDLGHGFHQNERGQIRCTISPEARKEILQRLLALNLEIAAPERGDSSAERESAGTAKVTP